MKTICKKIYVWKIKKNKWLICINHFGLIILLASKWNIIVHALTKTIITLVFNQAVSERNRSDRPHSVSSSLPLSWCYDKSCNEWSDATSCTCDQKRGSEMRRVWPVMDCVIIQPWRCRSLERNGLLCLLLLCQCNLTESRCYKSPAQHSWCWKSRSGWDESFRNTLSGPGALDWEKRVAC